MKITPRMAQEWWDKYQESVANGSFENYRPFSERDCNAIVADIKAGRWHYDATPIRFDDNDNLIDGQHRIMAIIRAGIAVVSMVVWGVEGKEAVRQIDTNRPRTLTQHFKNEGYKDAIVASGTCVTLWRLRNRQWGPGPNRRKPTTEESFATMRRNKSRVYDAIQRTKGPQGHQLMCHTLAGALHVMFIDQNHEAADDFFDYVTNGSSNGKTPQHRPVVKLRTALEISKPKSARQGRLSVFEQSMLAIHCFNMERAKRHIARLQIPNDLPPILTDEQCLDQYGA